MMLEERVKMIKVNCWHCGKKFDMPLDNYFAGELFCSEECRIDDLKREMRLKKGESK
ncbi:MAG: hypothetical protein ACOCUH_02785 [Bacteriovoracia bacterium]